MNRFKKFHAFPISCLHKINFPKPELCTSNAAFMPVTIG